MAPRRSTRLQNPPARETGADKHDTLAEAVVEGKGMRKTPTEKLATKAAAALKSGTTSKGKAPGLHPQSYTAGAQAKISSLPPEVLSMVLGNIRDLPAMAALGRTSKRFYSLTMPALYDRIAVAAMFHAHIPKLIRTLEPHLTIAQKKQLKKEGKYKGQQERFPTGLDERARPVCAEYVRRLVVGVADPGKKHKYIVLRYVEEALKNMENLEIVETRILTKSISQSLASRANLKALSLYVHHAEAEELKPLGRIKNLKHIHLQNYDTFETLNPFQSILRNSASTLQSLAIETDSYTCPFLKDWEKNFKTSAGVNTKGNGKKGPDFTALRSLSLSGTEIDENFIKEFGKAIDFAQLRELSLANLRDPQCLLQPYMISRASSYQGTADVPLSLRTLSLNMTDHDYMHDTAQQNALFEAKCRFISSFDTLTTLELPDYPQHPANTTNPGLSNTLVQAILKHKNLRVLRISYKGRTSGFDIPYLGPETVRTIVDGLHQLREFEFAPDEGKMDEISQALLRGSHLESITCFPHASWASYPPAEQPGVNIVSSILSAFVSNPKLSLGSASANKKFVWEDYYKLNRVSVIYKNWDIASGFGKPKKGGKGAERPERITMGEADGAREVWYRLAKGTIHIHVGHDPEFEWVTKADRELT
ncbi:putative F-box domain-containing protein [Seiridium cardinale]|uniref:F-box domain-containing protein n=1 Tax=Seiridium cardinale TaxID=138064 RepID=A0ABR2XZ76_9PEZI